MKIHKLYFFYLLIISALTNCIQNKTPAKLSSENQVVIETDTVFLSNKSDSIYQKLFPTGQVEMKGKLVNKNKEGRWVTYYKEGKICKEIDYKQGVMNGKYIWYFENGKKMQETDLIEGVKHGKEKYWNKDGSLNSITTYENGEKTEIRAYKPNYINTTDTTSYEGDIIWKK
jgi:antitoxin component YwqK of YwqJK toxin-antitoxin module